MSLARLGRQLDTATRSLFAADDDLGADLLALAGHWMERDEHAGTPAALPVLAVLGLDGQARLTAARMLVNGAELETEIEEASRRGLFLGPQLPTAAPGDASLRRVETDSLAALGRPWALWLPAPGPHPDLAGAGAVLLPLAYDQLRDRRLEELLERARGLPVQPLIFVRNIRGPSEEQRDDARDQLARWQEEIGDLDLAEILWMADPALDDQSTPPEDLLAALRRTLGDDELLARARRRQAAAEEAAARVKLAEILAPWRARLGAPLERLNQLTGQLPTLVEDQLIGEEALLRTGLRGRFRADLLERTPLLLFPLRSLLGVLALTLGAWDRVVFASFGSIPSLVGSALAGWHSWRESGQLGERLQPGLRGRVEALLAENHAPDLARFTDALDAAGAHAKRQDPPRIALHGLDGLEAATRERLTATVRHQRLPWAALLLLALLGTIVFWILLSGPLLTIYRDYLEPLLASWRGWTDATGHRVDHTTFPAPEFGYWLTALLLSFAPTLLLAMVLVAWACSGRRVHRAAIEVREQLRQEIDERLHEGQLRIELHDPQVEAARRLAELSRSTN